MREETTPSKARELDLKEGEVKRDWEARVKAAHLRPVHRKNIVDDGFFSYMAEGARYEGVFEIPVLKKPRELVIPELRPISWTC